MSTLEVNKIKKDSKELDSDYVIEGSAKAWVANATQTSGNTYGNAFNVSSFVDHGTGQIRINMTNAMASTQYAVTTGTIGSYPYQGESITASQFSISTINSSGNYTDGASNGAIHGDLA